MSDSQTSIVAQAKQGDAKAIAILLNHKLQPKGITVKASVKNSCLHVMLEAAKTPTQQPLVEFLRKSFAGISSETWDSVRVYGRKTGEEIPDWVEDFAIEREASPTLEDLAKQGDRNAIATLLNRKLQPNGVTAKVSLKDDCLQIMLEGAEVPEQEEMVSLLKSEAQTLEIPNISALKIYSKQSGEEFPDWQEEVSLHLDESETQEAQSSSLVIASSSEITETVIVNAAAQEDEPAETIRANAVAQEIDSIALSNRIYDVMQATCYQHFAYRMRLENSKTIHEIVEDFMHGLEVDLRLDLDQFSKQAVETLKAFNLEIESSEVKNMITDVANSNFTGVRLAIRDLERVTREVLQTNFPKETDTLKAFFSGAAQEFSARIFGGTTMSKEAIIGTVIGTAIAPGFGSFIGGAIGGWIGGNKQQKAIEEIINKHQNSRGNLFREWGFLLEILYTKLGIYLSEVSSTSLLHYGAITQSIKLYNEGSSFIEKDPQKSVDLYDQALQLNPGLVPAWNNKGVALNQLKLYEDALVASVQAVKLHPTLAIAYNNCGRALQGLGRQEEAILAYRESINLDPENFSAWCGMESCLYHLQQFNKAIEVTDKLINLNPTNFLGWYAKACCQTRLGYLQQALDNLKEAVRLNPEASQHLARNDPDFDSLRKDERFIALMISSVGINYGVLRRYLERKQWREADQETARLIREIIQKLTASTEINPTTLSVFPCLDLNTIDSLWRTNSDGRFGFSVQKEIYKQCAKNRDRFGEKIDWRIKDWNGNYSWRNNTAFNYNSTTAPRGHLPSSLWAGEDVLLENRRDRLIALFDRMDYCSTQKT